MFQAPKEMYALVEEKCGPLWAKGALWSLVLTTIGAALYGGLIVSIQVYERVSPFVTTPGWIPGVTVSFATTLGVAVLLALVVRRWFRNFGTLFIQNADQVLNDVRSDVARLSERVAALG